MTERKCPYGEYDPCPHPKEADRLAARVEELDSLVNEGRDALNRVNAENVELRDQLSYLRKSGIELQSAIARIDTLVVPPDQAKKDTEAVGGPVGWYCVDFDHDAVVERVRKRVAELEKPPAMESDVKLTITINVGAEGLTVANYAEAAMGDRAGFSTGCALVNYPVPPGTYDLVSHGRVEELEAENETLKQANAYNLAMNKSLADENSRLAELAGTDHGDWVEG